MFFGNGVIVITIFFFLSGLCTLNFSAVESLLSLTATDCWASFAPYLANVVCCPQFSACLVTLVGQFSKYSGMLALNLSHSKHCLSDVEKILTSRGANPRLQKICSIQPANLTEASCPVVTIDAFESIVESSRLLSACQKIDNVNECCDQVCQNAISYAAQKIALNGMSVSSGSHDSPKHLTRVEDCKNIVLQWLASKLDPPSANSVLRGLSNCKINKGEHELKTKRKMKITCTSLRSTKECLFIYKPCLVLNIFDLVICCSACPLVFPNITNVVKECAHVIRNQTACCEAMESYISKLQEQSFITNVQALHCVASLGTELQKANVSDNVYNLCHINIKDFSLQGQCSYRFFE